MTVSPQTKEIAPYRCSICGKSVIEPAAAAREGNCPPCEKLLGWFRKRCDRVQVTTETPLFKLAEDSIEYVEMLMELEDEFDQEGPRDAEMITMSVGDAIRWVRARQADA